MWACKSNNEWKIGECLNICTCLKNIFDNLMITYKDDISTISFDEEVKCKILLIITIQQCSVKSILIHLNSNKLPYYPFVVSLDRCDGSCKILEYTHRDLCLESYI